MLYEITTGAIRIGLRLAKDWKVLGTENLPPFGPVILASNHLSNVDPLFLVAASPRPVHFMAKVELFRIPVLAGFLRRVGSFPVRRGSSDRQAIAQAVAVLEAGQVLGIFVEGTRNPNDELLPFRNGAAMLAHRTNAPIVPVMVRAKGRKVSVSFGSPIILPTAGDQSRKERYSTINERLFHALQGLT